MTWVLVIIFSWQPVGEHGFLAGEIQHTGIVVPGFHSRQACKDALEQLATSGSKSSCVQQ